MKPTRPKHASPDFPRGVSFRPSRLPVLIGAFGLPLSAQALTDQQLLDYGVVCTRHPDVVDLVESGSSMLGFSFDSTEAQGDRRVCFGPNFYYYGLSSPLFSTVSSVDDPVIFVPGGGLTNWISLESGSLNVNYLQGTNSPYGVFRWGNYYVDASVSWMFSGDATPEADYHLSDNSTGGETLASSGIFEFPAWDRSSRDVFLTLIDDDQPEDDELIQFTLHSPTADGVAANILGESSHTLNRVVLDDDRYPTRLTHAIGCTRLDPPQQLFDSGSSLYTVQSDGQLSPTELVGTGASGFVDTACSVPIIVAGFTTGTGSGSPLTPPSPQIAAIEPMDQALGIWLQAETDPHPYTAVCTPLGGGSPIFGQGEGSPVQVTGLNNDLEYSCVVEHSGFANPSAAVQAKPRAGEGARAIPTLAGWGMILLSMLTALVAWLGFGRVGKLGDK